MASTDKITKCTCDIKAEPYGTAQLVMISYSQPRPVPAAGYTIISYEPEKCPKIIGSADVQQTMGGSSSTIYSYTAGDNSYFGYDCFAEPIYAQVPYDAESEFAMSASVLLENIIVEDEQGMRYEISDYTGSISDTVEYTQHPETGGWGSEQQKNLFIPWQDIR